MNNIKFESMLGGQQTTESEATVFQAKIDQSLSSEDANKLIFKQSDV